MRVETQGRVVSLIRFEESYRRFPYRCTAGKLTVGIGRNLDDKGVSLDEARYLCVNDIFEVESALTKAFKWFVYLDAVRRGVLISMGFQMGVPGLLKFVRTLGAVGRGDYDFAAKCMLESEWAKQTQARALRASEMMRTGEWCKEIEE
jgi:lysozyme